MPLSDELRDEDEAIAFFHEARERKVEKAGDDQVEGDDEEEVVLSNPPVANPYASKLKEKQVAGSYKGGKTPPKKKGRGKGGKGGRAKRPKK